MKKLLIGFVALFGFSTAFGLSCMQPEPLPPLSENLAGFETIGLLEIMSFGEEEFMEQKNLEFPNVTAEGKNRKYTTHNVKWKSLKKGIQNNEEFILKINATSWMGIPDIFKPGTILPMTTNALIEEGVMTLDQDFGCGRSDWARHSVEEISKLKDQNPAKEIKKPKNNNEKMNSWESFKNWFYTLFS